MSRAVWNGVVLAESDETVVLEGNHYFPVEALNTEYFTDSTQRSTCPWKGVASYYDVVVNGDTNRAAAWYYADPKPAASDISGHVAFWRGVRVEH
ncbi:MAG: DUF427 domain-containing protein [Actinomycetota bacterium]|nr:DUF427 domain-containing protein [Actinomycetota bacterium]